MRLLTIGYEGLSVNEFFCLLKRFEVDTIVDVRELPLSRKPGFSKSALKNRAMDIGINYIHSANLGCPRETRHMYRKDGDWNFYTKKYLAHLENQQQSLKQLAELIKKKTCCLVCFEKDVERCHRSFIAKAIKDCYFPAIIICDLRTIKTTEAELVWMEGIPSQLSTIDLGIDALCP